jgi:nitrogen-specific signal transduction histidine kinase
MTEEKAPQNESRDFGEVLRHELNNPLTGILGNAELLLVELRRKHLELPSQFESRLATIAELAVRMRETVRQLSEKWQATEIASGAGNGAVKSEPYRESADALVTDESLKN